MASATVGWEAYRLGGEARTWYAATLGQGGIGTVQWDPLVGAWAWSVSLDEDPFAHGYASTAEEAREAAEAAGEEALDRGRR